jgi:hypothetical protein
MAKNNRLRSIAHTQLVGKYLPSDNDSISNKYVDGKVKDPDGLSKDEEEYFLRMYQEDKIRNLESLEELPEDYIITSQH